MGTHYLGTSDERRALDAYIKLMRAADSVSARLDRSIKAQGLTTTQFGVLEALFHLGPMCQRALGTKLLKSGGNVTTVVGNLERASLVSRTRSDEDRRLVTVSLTETGRRRISAMLPAHVKLIECEMSSLSPDELEQLGSWCKRLGAGPRNDSTGGRGDRRKVAGQRP